VPELRREPLEYEMNKDDYQKWVEACRKRANQPDFSNDRDARAATLEERLTLADQQLLHEMGILL
jgi:hypothetical protein